MNEENDFALVPRPPSEIEKVEPGAKRVLSGMVSDMLALTGRQLVTKPVVSVAMCGWDYDGLHCELIGLIIEREFAMRSKLELKGFAWTTDLIEAARQSRFDLFILLLNPGIYSRKDTAQRRLGREVNWDEHGDEIDAYEYISRLKQEFGRPIFVISNEIKYSLNQNSRAKFEKAGVDAVFSTPFGMDEFRLALQRCLKVPGVQAAVQSVQPRGLRPPRIVVVDDEEGSIRVAEILLRNWFGEDFTSLKFLDSNEAWQELSRADPDLLITRDRMLSMTGEEICRRLFDRKATFPIIVTGGWHPTEDWVRELATRGLNVKFLLSPISVEQFNRELLTHFGRSNESSTQFRNNEP